MSAVVTNCVTDPPRWFETFYGRLVTILRVNFDVSPDHNVSYWSLCHSVMFLTQFLPTWKLGRAVVCYLNLIVTYWIVDTRTVH